MGVLLVLIRVDIFVLVVDIQEIGGDGVGVLAFVDVDCLEFTADQYFQLENRIVLTLRLFRYLH